MVKDLQDRCRVSERRACKVVQFHSNSHRYISTRDEQATLRMRIKEIAAEHVQHGYKRITILLRPEGWQVNHKRVHRLYCEEGLNLRDKRPKRRVSAAHRMARDEATLINESWSLDFVSDSLFDGKRMLTVVDNFSRE